MLTDHQGDIHTHKNKHKAERLENMLGVIMVIAIAILAVGLIYGIMSTGNQAPAWMR